MVHSPPRNGKINTPDGADHTQQGRQGPGGLYGEGLKNLAPHGMRKRRRHPTGRTRVARTLVKSAGGLT